MRHARRLNPGPHSFLTAALIAAACGGEPAPTANVIEIADVGFMTPESVLMDTVADVYLVSNINGSPLEKDDNGFISRLTPDGLVENLKWIDGANPAYTLHAPKGMAIRGDTLFVTDINCIRLFHRVTGEFVEGECIEGATFLNDLAVDANGAIYVTDTGMQAGEGGALEPSGSDGVYRYAFQAGRVGATIAKNPELGHPNGLAIGPRGIFVATFGSGEIYALTVTGEKRQVFPPSNLQLDGIVFTNDGGFLFSAWGDSTVRHVSSTGQLTRLMTGVPAPADIGYDPKRDRVLIPLFLDNKVIIRPLS